MQHPQGSVQAGNKGDLAASFVAIYTDKSKKVVSNFALSPVFTNLAASNAEYIDIICQ